MSRCDGPLGRGLKRGLLGLDVVGSSEAGMFGCLEASVLDICGRLADVMSGRPADMIRECPAGLSSKRPVGLRAEQPAGLSAK